jgi:hypothetical protein
MLKGIIKYSSSLFKAPVLLRMMPDGGLQFCVDYYDNKIQTIKIQYPLSMIQDTQNLLGEAMIYKKLDCC